MSDTDLPGPTSVSDILDRVEAASRDETQMSLARVFEALGQASFVPVLMAPALAVVTPLSGVPLFSSICGLTIALISAQMLLHRRHLWLPDFLLRRKVAAKRVREAIDWMRRPARWLDGISRHRLGIFVRRPFRWITQTACLLCGLAMPLLELVPFTSSILGAAVVLFALGLLARDGLFALIGIFFVIGAGVVGVSLAGG